VSPDGRLVAYASDRAGRGDLDIWVQQAAGGVPLRLTDDPSDDHSPDFSPDGKQIAFRSARAGGGIYLMPALGGPQRLVIADGRTPRFSPDGERLVYRTGAFRGLSNALPSRLFVIPLEGGTPVQIAGGFAVALDPVWAPDGRALLFLGRSDETRPLRETFDWWWAPLDGAPPVKVGAFETAPLSETVAYQSVGSPTAWTRAGVLFTAGDDNLWTLPLSLDGRPTGPPQRLTNLTGRAEAPSVAPDGSLVFAVTHSQRAIERIAVEPGSGHTRERLYADNRSVAMRASTSADGSLVVFEQGFDGYYEIWSFETRTFRQQMVLRATSRLPVNPTVSGDGARVAYSVTRAAGSDEQTDGYVVELTEGVPKPVCQRCLPYGFLSDDRRLLATWDRRRAIGVIDTRDGSRVELVREASGELDRPHASADDRWLAFRQETGERFTTYVVPLTPHRVAARSSWQRLDEPTTTGRPCGWALDTPTLFLLLDTDGFRCIWGQRVDPGSGRLQGPVFPVQHLHEQMEGTGPSTSLGNPVSAAGFLYERTIRAGDIWRLAPHARGQR
jgi:Tol biopolymer transport system component